MRRFTVVAIVCVALAGLGANGASAARNPNGSGQPSVECGDPGATSQPGGFGTSGFANAEDHYASGANGNSKAVSQYDVACYQVTSHPGG
jgi:hypothetical protein